MIPPEEARHLRRGPRCGESAGGVGLVEVVAEAADPELVLQRCRAVMGLVVGHQSGDWPGVSVWREILPGWFLDACVDESPLEVERWLQWWRSLPANEQAEAEQLRAWSLPDWLYWFEPGGRSWFWWDGVLEEENVLRISVEVAGWPSPLGALSWLLRAAGAANVVVED